LASSDPPGAPHPKLTLLALPPPFVIGFAIRAAEHLELGALHTTGACLGHVGQLTRLRSLHCGGVLRLSGQGLAAVAALRLPALEALSLVDLAPDYAPDDAGSRGSSTGGAPSPPPPGPGAAARASSSDGGAAPAAAAADRHGARPFWAGRVSAAGPSEAAPAPSLDTPPALAVLRALPAASPALRNLRLGSCRGLKPAAALAASLGALTSLECAQLLDAEVGPDDLAAALAPGIRCGASPLLSVDVRSAADLGDLRSAARVTAGQVAAAAAGSGDLLEAAAGFAAVQAAAAVAGLPTAWPAPGGGNGGGGGAAAAPGGGGGPWADGEGGAAAAPGPGLGLGLGLQWAPRGPSYRLIRFERGMVRVAPSGATQRRG
jgi:hypothetical protein